MDWVGLLSGLVALAGTLFKFWLDNSPARLKEKQDAETRKVRNAIVTGNVAVINSATDGLLCDVSLPTTGTASDSAGQQHSADSTAQGISDLLGTKIVLR